MGRLAIVVTCYNEEEVFEETNKQLLIVINDLINKNKIDDNSYIMYVNDGSNDTTWDKIKNAYEKNKPLIRGLNFAGNKGHQNAVYAGLMYAKKRC